MTWLKRIQTILKREGKLLSLLVRFFQNIFGESTLRNKSTLHLAIHYILRLTVFALCFLGCFGQIGAILNIFFSFPSIVFVDLYQMDKLYLPGMTICNDNRVMRSKLRAYDAKFAAEWNRLLNQSAVQNSKDLKLYQQQLIDNLIRRMMSNLTVSEFMTFGNTADDFFDSNFFRCASDKNGGADKKCILLSNLLTTAQENGNCFTLFHHSSSHELQDIAIASGLSESAVVRGSINESVNIEASLKPFAPNEILRFRINFREEEYTTLNEPVSGRFTLHDNRQLAVVRERSYLIQPGKYYIFYLTKLTDELLPAPYITDCRDYGEQKNNKIYQTNNDNNNDNNNNNSTNGNTLFNSPASKNNCIIGCIAKKTVQTCNCWPPELPYLYTGIVNDSISTLRWCDWREKPPISDENVQNKPGNVTWFQFCFNAHENDCNHVCKADCRIDRYKIMKEEMEWPSKERIEHSEEGNNLKALRECCSVISIRYWTAEQKINRYKPRFEIAEFTSYIGGLLSMWLGFSLFGFYNLVERTIQRLWMYFKEKHSGIQNSNHNHIDRDLSSKNFKNQSKSFNENIRNSNNEKNNIINFKSDYEDYEYKSTIVNKGKNHNDNNHPIKIDSKNKESKNITLQNSVNYSQMSLGLNTDGECKSKRFHHEYETDSDEMNTSTYSKTKTSSHVHWMDDHEKYKLAPIYDRYEQKSIERNNSFDYLEPSIKLRQNFYRNAQPPTPMDWAPPLIRRYRLR